ncbi:zingipain-2-like isoform X2 [Daphnia pulex]|nr:zingipain-2-like isoform X2 [Daphnia pulex]
MGKFSFILAVMMMASWTVGIQGEDVETAWQKYLAEYPMPLPTMSESNMRKTIFTEIHAKIEQNNAQKGANFEMTHNIFSVMTDAEKQSYLGARLPVPPSNLTRGPSVAKLPATMDYRNDPCMPPVRNQGGCGSCWAYTASAVVEFGKCKKSGGNAIDLSEQQIVDCSPGSGCSGGWEHDAWKYLASCGGHALESSYPYAGRDGACRFSPTGMTIGAKLLTSNPVEWVPSKDTSTMMNILSDGRILTVYIHLPDSFFNYKSGIFDDTKCNSGSAHALNPVGYGTLNGVDYWVMRNSWGAGWGSSGYVLVKRGIDLCLIESYARTTNIDTTTTTSLENFCTNRSDGNYANPNECQSYISCSNGSAYKMNCPSGLAFNEKYNSCDYSYNVPGCN